jgi:UDP-glucose 4-epimerase
MTRSLVLGAGLLGGHIARHLADSGYAVDVFSRGFNPWFHEERRDGIDVHVGRIETETHLLRELVEAADLVIHLASSSRPPVAARAPVVDLEQTVTPALTAMQVVSQCSTPTLFLMCSSGGTIYGQPRELPTPESHPFQPTTPYAITHVALEHYLDYFRRAHGLEAITLRFANVYGPGEFGRGGQGVIGTWLHQIAIGERPVVIGGLSVSRDFVYVEDAARATSALIEGGHPGTAYNVGSSTTTSLLDLLDILRSVTGVEIESTPGMSPADDAGSVIQRTLLDTTLIGDHVGWSCSVPLEVGVERAWRWMTEEWLARSELAGAFAAE